MKREQTARVGGCVALGKEVAIMKTWTSQKKNRRLAVLVAGTLGLTAALVACPPVVDMRAAGVEIGSSIAYAAEDEYTRVDVSTLADKTFQNKEKSY